MIFRVCILFLKFQNHNNIHTPILHISVQFFLWKKRGHFHKLHEHGYWNLSLSLFLVAHKAKILERKKVGKMRFDGWDSTNDSFHDIFINRSDFHFWERSWTFFNSEFIEQQEYVISWVCICINNRSIPTGLWSWYILNSYEWTPNWKISGSVKVYPKGMWSPPIMCFLLLKTIILILFTCNYFIDGILIFKTFH